MLFFAIGVKNVKFSAKTRFYKSWLRILDTLGDYVSKCVSYTLRTKCAWKA